MTTMSSAAKVLLAAATAGFACAAQATPAAPTLRTERVVLLMRHGLRPPTKNPPMAGVAAEAWPAWPVNPGWLTPPGAAAVRILGGYDRVLLARSGLFAAKGCPAADGVALVSDSDQRTIATGDAYLEGLAPGCGIANVHRPQDQPDPMFGAIEAGAGGFDAARARAAVEQALGSGGIAAAEAEQRDALARIDRIYCGSATTGCGVTARPSGLADIQPGKRPKLTGALDLGSTAGQILLLEYGDGKPMAEVGWGRASRADVTAVGALHAAEFRILARPLYIAARNVAPIAKTMLGALTDAKAAKLTVIVGHDTNVANLGGLLDIHWQADGLAADDPPPGGAIGFALLRDAQGGRFVRAIFRSQSLDQMRGLKPPAAKDFVQLAIPGCPGPCRLDTFERLMNEQLKAD
jgi:4-phytase/acid phosphatase